MKNVFRWFVWALLLAPGLCADCSEARSGLPATHYTIILENPVQHLVRVEVQVPTGSAQRDFQLPVWNATYQVRDFSQYVLWLRAKAMDGSSLGVTKINKSLWRVSGLDRGGVIEYQVLADQSGPFGTELTSEHGFFNFAQILVYPLDARSVPMSVQFERVPEGWRMACALSPDSEKASEVHAADYDELVDSPVELGKFQESSFLDTGGKYRIVVDAAAADYDIARLQELVRKIVHSETAWMQDRPFQNYLFIYHFPSDHGGGGMEHAYSAAIELSAHSLRESPDDFASVTAHEFFHLWNIKRTSPQALAPVDYTKENYTRSLWFSEGVTSTVGEYVLVQAGLLNEKEYLRKLSNEITTLQTRPAHLTQSAEESSLDAWLEKYPSYRQAEHSVSYYNKGLLLGVILDLAIRKASHDGASLRELFLYLNQTYAKKGKYFDESEGIRNALEALSGGDFGAFFHKYVAGTEEIPYDEFLSWVGLRVVVHEKAVPDSGFRASRNVDAAPVVISIAPATETEKSGLTVGDTILLVDGAAPVPSVEAKIRGRAPGDLLRVRVRTADGSERELNWKLGSRKTLQYEVVNVEALTPEQTAHRKLWLTSPPQGAAN